MAQIRFSKRLKRRHTTAMNTRKPGNVWRYDIILFIIYVHILFFI